MFCSLLLVMNVFLNNKLGGEDLSLSGLQLGKV